MGCYTPLIAHSDSPGCVLDFTDMSAKKNPLVQRLTRPNEGVAIDIIRHPIIGGARSQQISMDMSSARVPDRRYPADIADVLVSDDMVRLLFGQKKLTGTGLLSVLVIHTSFWGARQFMNSMGEAANIGLRYMEEHHVPTAQLYQVKEEPNQTVPLAANIIAAAFAGRDACMDFYHASAFSIRGLGLGAGLYADPVVRITLTTPLLLAIYDALHAKKDKLPDDKEDSQ